jgi:hypothetical protein
MFELYPLMNYLILKTMYNHTFLRNIINPYATSALLHHPFKTMACNVCYKESDLMILCCGISVQSLIYPEKNPENSASMGLYDCLYDVQSRNGLLLRHTPTARDKHVPVSPDDALLHDIVYFWKKSLTQKFGLVMFNKLHMLLRRLR